MIAIPVRTLLTAIATTLACGDPARPPTPIATPRVRPAPVAPDPTCDHLLTAHRHTLQVGREGAISRDGRGIYRGLSIDHFADGTSATVLSLEVFERPWLPDDRDRAYHPFGDHCVRLISSTGNRVVLEVALQKAHEYDSHRCHMGCCAPGASTAPDGSEECCFCSDDPDR